MAVQHNKHKIFYYSISQQEMQKALAISTPVLRNSN